MVKYSKCPWCKNKGLYEPSTVVDHVVKKCKYCPYGVVQVGGEFKVVHVKTKALSPPLSEMLDSAPKMSGVEIRSYPVTSSRRKLKTVWTQESDESYRKRERELTPILMLCEECGHDVYQTRLRPYTCQCKAPVRLVNNVKWSIEKTIRVTIEALEKGYVVEEGVSASLVKRLKESIGESDWINVRRPCERSRND